MTIQAVSDWESEIQKRRTLLLNSLLLATVLGGLIALISVHVSLPTGMSTEKRWASMSPFFAGWLVTLVALLESVVALYVACRAHHASMCGRVHTRAMVYYMSWCMGLF